MRKSIVYALLGIFFLVPLSAEAQILKKINKKVKDKTERRIEKKIDKSIDKGLDKVEEGMEGKEDEKSPEGKNGEGQSAGNNETIKLWSKYDFVPGEVVIFEDDLLGERNGEFPSQWDLKKGNVEMAQLGDYMVINFPDTEWADIVPMMKEKGDYLPDVFTLEFDAYYSEFCTSYKIAFFDEVNQKNTTRLPNIYIKPDQVTQQFSGVTDFKGDENYPYWKRIAISFNVRALKIYLGEQRIANIPNFRHNPTGITISSRQCHENQYAAIRNIRIATGDLELYNKMITDGKIVTNGIRFDSGKATLRPESMGVINEISKLMQQYPEIKFSVEGHTDSDGDGAFNKNLSEQRAATVMNTLIDMGISGDRLVSKGFGEDMPIADNNSPEGKANNRRVEFVKM
ncbi:OmpA family protein [Robiginitalea sp. IMCC44478]|uniref:OmpA family protein n=1 Tax=Robiginitalea sp. IMCC44478 TaxID=3459122 RepID=UPI0040425004